MMGQCMQEPALNPNTIQERGLGMYDASMVKNKTQMLKYGLIIGLF